MRSAGSLWQTLRRCRIPGRSLTRWERAIALTQMFCPVCEAEYRPGFFRCTDCNVALVATPLEVPASNQSRVHANREAAAVLCQEDDPAILTAILSALSEARIPYYDYPIQDAKAHFSTLFPGGLSLAQGYEILVLKSDLPVAQNILKNILDNEDELPPAASGENPSEGASGETERQIPDDWDPAVATAEIWSGEDETLAEFLADTLRENGILSCAFAQPGSRLCLLTLPEDANRARKIVREVVEGTPPA